MVRAGGLHGEGMCRTLDHVTKANDRDTFSWFSVDLSQNHFIRAELGWIRDEVNKAVKGLSKV